MLSKVLVGCGHRKGGRMASGTEAAALILMTLCRLVIVALAYAPVCAFQEQAVMIKVLPNLGTP